MPRSIHYPTLFSRSLSRLLLMAGLLNSFAPGCLGREPVPQWNWLTVAGSTNYSQTGTHGMVVDCAGNVWVAGGFSGRLTLPNGSSITSSETDASLVMLLDYKTGHPSRAFAGPGFMANAIALDMQERPVIGGSDGNFFVTAFDTIGNRRWSQSATYNPGNTSAVAVDNHGDVYIAGTIAEGDVMFGTNKLTCLSYGTAGFMAKLDGSNGTILWAKTIPLGSGYGNAANGLAMDPSGNIYVVGFFTDPSVFLIRKDQTFVVLTNSAGSPQIYLAQFDPNGNLIQIIQSSTDDSEWGAIGQDVKVTSTGKVYVTGHMYGGGTRFSDSGPALVNSGAVDVFVAAYNNQLQSLWSCAGHLNDLDGRANCYSLAVDAVGNIELFGTTDRAITFDLAPLGTAVKPGYVPPQNTIPKVTSGQQGFVAKYNAAGWLEWATGGGGQSDFVCVAGAIDAAGNTYIGGANTGTNIFGAYTNSGMHGLTLYNAKLETSGPLLKIHPPIDALVHVSWSSLANGFQLQSSSKLMNWVTLTNATASDGCETSVAFDKASLSQALYYRLKR